MDKPACFQSYTPSRRTACAECAWRGPCASRTTVAGFSFMSHPRYPRAAVKVNLAPVLHDRVMRETTFSAAQAAGLCRRGHYVCVGRRKLARLDPGVQGTVRVSFDCIPAHRVASLPSASRASIRPLLLVQKQFHTMREIRQHRRLWEVGCTAVLSRADDAAALLLDVARTCYGDRRD